MDRIQDHHLFQSKEISVREAHTNDAEQIIDLYHSIYKGFYPLEFGSRPEVIQGEINDRDHYLWIVAEWMGNIIGAVMFCMDPQYRLGKAAGAVVARDYRQAGLAAAMLKAGVNYLTEIRKHVDVIYGTTRTINEGPSRLVKEVGFRKMGLFPNGVQIERLEHLNLDVYFTQRALDMRRQNPYLYPPYVEFYDIAKESLGLEDPYVVNERYSLTLKKDKIKFHVIKDEKLVVQKFRYYKEQARLNFGFFPFHTPNWILESEDKGTEIFISYGGLGRQAGILGIRSDRTDIHEILDSTAIQLQREGAAYVEFLVNAYDVVLQRAAYTARFIPSAYFPSMKLAHDGYRDDYFVLSRTFALLDFTNAVVSEDNMKYLQAYLRCYYELYLQPLLGNVPLGPRAPRKLDV